MSQHSRFNSFVLLLIFAMYTCAVAAAQDQTGTTPRIVTVKIKVDDLSMAIVPVSINGSGPYDFLLDTGSNTSIIDRKLAAQLGLPAAGENTTTGLMASSRTSVVRINSLSVAGAAIGASEIVSSDAPGTISGKIRGMLGEDFLRNFDLLLDYGHSVLALESAAGSIAESARGEHFPLQLEGILQGKPTENRLIVSGSIPDLDGKPMTLLLDSGANQLVLFRDTLSPGLGHIESVPVGGVGSWTSSQTAMRRVHSLNIGQSSVKDLTVVVFARRAYIDADGLLPTSLFHSIFISHRGRFIIFNPSFPKTTKP